jgi:hypothetical protein
MYSLPLGLSKFCFIYSVKIYNTFITVIVVTGLFFCIDKRQKLQSINQDTLPADNAASNYNDPEASQ